jgi:hypothetical protein
VKEEVPNHSFLILLVTGESKDVGGHSRYESTEDSRCVCQVGQFTCTGSHLLFKEACLDALRGDKEGEVNEGDIFGKRSEFPS